MDGLFSIEGAAFSRSLDKSHRSVEAYALPNCLTFPDSRDLFEWASTEADMLLLLTPSGAHLSHVIDGLEARVPIVVEKPLARTRAEVAEIQRRAADVGVHVLTIYNYTGYPMVREARALVQADLIGDLHKARVHMPQETYLRVDASGLPIAPQEWRLHDDGVPMVGLDLGIHALNLLHFLTARRPRTSQGSVASFGNFPEVVDDIECLLGFSDGFQASLWVSKSAIGYRNGLSFSLLGRRGSLHWEQTNPERLLFDSNTGEKQILERGSPLVSEATDARLSRFKAGHPGGFVEALANYYLDVFSFLRYGYSAPGLGLLDVALQDQADLELVIGSMRPG